MPFTPALFNLAAVDVLAGVGVANLLERLRLAGLGPLAGGAGDYGLDLAMWSAAPLGRGALLAVADQLGDPTPAPATQPRHGVPATSAGRRRSGCASGG
jgi:hypothetical protein